MTTHSSKSSRVYTRFIPKEEVGEVTQWKFGAMDESAETPEAVEDLPPLPTPEQIEAEHQQALAQARAVAFAQGEEHGRTQANLEWQQRMDDYVAQQGREAAGRLDAIVRGMQEQWEPLRQGAAQEVLELACGIARQVLRQELQAQPQAFIPVVREALGMLSTDSTVAAVRLNPQDHALLESALQQEPFAPSVKWLADANVPLGGCLVEQAGMVIDGSLEKRWQRAIAPLGLDIPLEEQGDEPAR